MALSLTAPPVPACVMPSYSATLLLLTTCLDYRAPGRASLLRGGVGSAQW